MAVSRTKYQATDAEIIALFARHGIRGVTDIAPLGDGEFNAVYRVTAPEGSFALKVAPPPGAKVLSYERGMMRAEVYWYGEIRKHTEVAMPRVVAWDYTHMDLGADCFIMTLLDAVPLARCGFTGEEYRRAEEKKIGMLAAIHRVRGERFGYVQAGLRATWYEAVRSMAESLVRDCEALGQATPDGHTLLGLIDRHRAVLEGVPCRMVNFDLWDSNVLCRGDQLYWIDPERSFYGDPVADFITLGGGPKTPLAEKAEQLAVYARAAEEPLGAGREERIRYAVAVAYLALIEEVEKYVRYEPDNPVYLRNTRDARDMYDLAFAELA